MSSRWKSTPGSYTACGCQIEFPALNRWGIPEIPPTQPEIPACLAPFGQRIRTDQPLTDTALHFFLDDYRFERVWTSPNRTLGHARRFGAVLSPQWSLYIDHPRAVQIWNTYRNRWMGAFWASHGIAVIPSLAWSDKQSFDFAFCGVAPAASRQRVLRATCDFAAHFFHATSPDARIAPIH